MDNHLYDHEIDAYPTPQGLHASGSAVTQGSDGNRPKPAKGKAAPGPRPGSFLAWVGGLSLANVVGVGLAVGVLVSALLALAVSLRIERHRVPSARAPKSESHHSPDAVGDHHAHVGLAAVMDGMRRTVNSTTGDGSGWKRTGLPHSRLTQGIDAVLEKIRKATGDPTVSLPVRFGGVPLWSKQRPNYGRRLDDLVRGLYVWTVPFEGGPVAPIGPGLRRETRATGAIVLVHGDVVLSQADDCLIVATGDVRVTWTSRSAIFAGRLIEIRDDTESLLVASSQIRVEHSHDEPGHPRHRPAIYAAPAYVSTGPEGAGVIVINAARQAGSLGPGGRVINRPDLDLGDEIRNRPVKINLDIVRAYEQFIFVQVRGVPGSVKVRESEPLVDSLGRPLPGLEGWNVQAIERDFTIISNNDRKLKVLHRKSMADPFPAYQWPGRHGHGPIFDNRPGAILDNL